MDDAEAFDRQCLEEALEVLESRLTTADKSEAFDIYKEMGSQIRWGRWVDRILERLLKDAEALFLGGTRLPGDENDSVKGDIWYSTSREDVYLFEDEDPKAMSRQHLILLWFVKKLLGAAKTRVNQSIDEVPVLSEDEEAELEALTQEVDGSDVEGLHQESGASMSLGEAPRIAANSRGPELTVDLEALHIELAVEGPCRSGPRHRRVQIRPRRKQGVVVFEHYCRDCRKAFKTVPIGSLDLPVLPEHCPHRGATWVKGKEGQEACCFRCEAPVEADSYNWAGVGLEPFGDDPTEDKVVVLCTEF